MDDKLMRLARILQEKKQRSQDIYPFRIPGQQGGLAPRPSSYQFADQPQPLPSFNAMGVQPLSAYQAERRYMDQLPPIQMPLPSRQGGYGDTGPWTHGAPKAGDAISPPLPPMLEGPPVIPSQSPAIPPMKPRDMGIAPPNPGLMKGDPSLYPSPMSMGSDAGREQQMLLQMGEAQRLMREQQQMRQWAMPYGYAP